MSSDTPTGCVQPAEGPILKPSKGRTAESAEPEEEVNTMQVTVGKEAPDFGATAYHEGGFTNIKLSDYRGKWVFLCFYPGDFTFV